MMVSEGLSKADPSSYSNSEACQVKDMHLNLKVDFGRQVLIGYVDILVIRSDPKVDSVILDSGNLVIHNVKNKSTLENMTYTLGDHVECFGSKLEIVLPKTVTQKFNIRIDYETSPQARALQWMEPAQTAGKAHPYLFSSSEPIRARTMFPCQDTPSIKFPYTASITAPTELTVLMSGIRDGEDLTDDPQTKVFKFVQKIPIPSYLVAIVVGALESRKIGPRTHVWSEKEFVDKAAFEFSETESMLKTAEDLLGPYVWEIYDILVLPPSFMLGGMENPCLTFVTPTLLAGDRSLASVIAHEICHSWTGNLVTNKDFQHFWLNEGFTRFVELKIAGSLHGKAYRHFLAIGGWKNLKYSVDTMGSDNPLTNLVVGLKGVDPEEAFSMVPYEKGHTFLFHLEELLGGSEVFDPFLRSYVENFKGQSIDTNQWKAYLYEYFEKKKDILDSVDWDAWLYTPGMPPLKPDYDTTLSNKCAALCKSWVDATSNDLIKFCKKDLDGMISNQIQELLALLLEEAPLTEEKMQKLTEVYELENVINSEIRFNWLRLGLRAQWKPVIPCALKFVTDQGRMKFVVPLYRDLYGWKESQELAISTYQKNCNEMMHVSCSAVRKVLHLDEETMDQDKS